MFDITQISEDSIFNLVKELELDFKEVAFINNDDGFIKEHHNHKWNDISFIMKGRLKYEIGDKSYTVSEGDVIIVPAGVEHREINELNDEFEVFFLCVCFRRHGELIDINKHLQIDTVISLSNIKEVYSLFESILSEVTYRRRGYLLKINALLYNLLVLIIRNKEVDNRLDNIKKLNTIRKKNMVNDIKDYLEANYADKISLNKLSRIFFLSPQYISSLFKQQTGYTLIEYLNKTRISNAKRLFAEGEKNISKVADLVGYGDLHYFCKVFKLVEDETPSRYISQLEE